MKRIIILSLTLIFALGGIVYAAGVNSSFDGFSVVKVQYEGKELKPDSVPGILYKGNTLVPLGLLRKAGFDVGWDSSTLTANITPKKVQSEAKKPLTLEQIRELSKKTVALVYALDDQGNRIRQGSGFIINSRGLLVTAWHVADEDGYRKLEVVLNGKTYYVPKGVYVFADKEKDLYGVYLQDSEPFEYLRVKAEMPKVGEKIYALGFPKEREAILSGEVVITITRIYDSAKIEGGSSGGALINEYGEVLGVVIKGNDSGGASVPIKEVQNEYQQSFNQ